MDTERAAQHPVPGRGGDETIQLRGHVVPLRPRRPDRRVDALFADYREAPERDKIILAAAIMHVLRSDHPDRRLSSALDRIKSLLPLIDVDHVDDLDAEVTALRILVEHGRRETRVVSGASSDE